ncbi:protein of unknown function [Cupriavidus neocaledonicus]|uniref:Uncharacterized protein n=1 Tax=Cupriavidus neocaledonicus TaxID=1040979 RepID=A0A375H0C0_9BURK|nr:protein of unknown function [Cupriavidus neocaledonicus]
MPQTTQAGSHVPYEATRDLPVRARQPAGTLRQSRAGHARRGHPRPGGCGAPGRQGGSARGRGTLACRHAGRRRAPPYPHQRRVHRGVRSDLAWLLALPSSRRCDAIVLPKAEAPQQVAQLAQWLHRWQPHAELVAIIETARGLAHVEAIAAVPGRVTAGLRLARLLAGSRLRGSP